MLPTSSKPDDIQYSKFSTSLSAPSPRSHIRPLNIIDKVCGYILGLMGDPFNGSWNTFITFSHNGIVSIIDATSMPYTQIEDWKGRTTRNKHITLAISQQKIIKLLNGYNNKMNREGTHLALVRWINVTKDVFDNFRISFSATDSDLTLPKAPGKTTIDNNKYTFDPLQSFNHAITRDPNLFLTLKYPKN